MAFLDQGRGNGHGDLRRSAAADGQPHRTVQAAELLILQSESLQAPAAGLLTLL
jgi:hypothetical protein